MSETPNLVVIDGKTVDVDKPCDLCRALQAYRIKLATGGAVSEFEIKSPLTSRRTKFAAGSSLSALDDMIAGAKAACEASIGGGPPRRTRYAMSGRFRPY